MTIRQSKLWVCGSGYGVGKNYRSERIMAVEVMGDNTINEKRLNIVKRITLLNVYI